MTSTIDSTPSSTTPPAVRRLERSTTDRVLGGVCGGLAGYTGIDPVLWRVGAVALALTGPGVLLYLLLWVLVPLAPAGPDFTPSVLETWAQRLRSALTGKRPTPTA